jgi:hypothetical protein
MESIYGLETFQFYVLDYVIVYPHKKDIADNK